MDKYIKSIEWFKKLAETEIAHGCSKDYVEYALSERLDGVKSVAANDYDISNDDYKELSRMIWRIKYNEEMPDFEAHK